MKSKINNNIFLHLFIFFIFSFLFFGKPYITDDGASYFALTKSLVNDFDFDLSNQRYLNKIVNYAVIKNKVTNRFVSSYSFGESLMQFPIFYYFNKANKFFIKNFNIKSIPYSFIEGLGILISSTFYSFLTVYLMYKLSLNLGESKMDSLFLSLTFFIGTHLFFYTFSSPAYPHIYEVFIVTLLLYFFIKFKKRFNILHIFLFGLLYGLLFTVRNVNIVFIIPFLLYLMFYHYKKKERDESIFIVLQRYFYYVLIFNLGFLPFLVSVFIYNKVQYGSIITTGYSNAGVFDLFPNYFLHYYFHPIRGIFWWSPVIILSMIGFGFVCRESKDKDIFLFSAFNIFIFTLTISFYNRWWGGLSFGQRYLTPTLPLFFIGMVYLFKNIKNKTFLKLIINLLTFYSFFLFLLFNINLNTRLGNQMLLKNDNKYNFFENIIIPIKSYKSERTLFEKNIFRFIFNRVFGGDRSTLIYKLVNYIYGIKPVEISRVNNIIFTKDKLVIQFMIDVNGEKNNFFIGLDVWGNYKVHPSNHLFWINSETLSNVKSGKTIGKVYCLLKSKKCDVIFGDKLLKINNFWFNSNIDEIYHENRTFIIDLFIYDNYISSFKIKEINFKEEN